jgi:THUMP domain-containing protein
MDDAASRDKLSFLLQPASLALLRSICADPRDDLALSGSPALRALPMPGRIAMLEQRKLRLKAARKCPMAMDMLFTPLGLEQLTHAELAAYKASRFPQGVRTVADLCCGLGGDSMYLPDRIRVAGLDLAPATLLAYRHNVSLRRGGPEAGLAVQGDVALSPLRADVALLDPARRARGKSDRWQDQDMSPGWDVMEKLIARYPAMAIKLGPGIAFPEFMESHEWEYLGLRDECLEAVVWTGELGRPGWVRAVELPNGAYIEALRADLPDTFGETGAPGGFLYEPVKSVVRSHLFGVLASRLRLWQIDPRIAYLSGNEWVRDPLLKAYRIIRELPYDNKAIKEFLRKEEVGRLEIKKRGVNLIPEEFRAGLRLSGPNQGTLIFTKVMERKTVFWTQAMGKEEAAAGDSSGGEENPGDIRDGED